MAHRLDLSLMFQELFSTRTGGFFGLDVIVSAMVLIIFIFAEGSRFGPSTVWLPIAATFLVSVSLGFPFFLPAPENARPPLEAIAICGFSDKLYEPHIDLGWV